MKEKYIYIRAWGIMMGSNSDYIDGEIELAKKDNAPETAIFKREDWHTYETITSPETKTRVQEIVNYLRK